MLWPSIYLISVRVCVWYCEDMVENIIHVAGRLRLEFPDATDPRWNSSVITQNVSDKFTRSRKNRRFSRTSNSLILTKRMCSGSCDVYKFSKISIISQKWYKTSALCQQTANRKWQWLVPVRLTLSDLHFLHCNLSYSWHWASCGPSAIAQTRWNTTARGHYPRMTRTSTARHRTWVSQSSRTRSRSVLVVTRLLRSTSDEHVENKRWTCLFIKIQEW